MLLDSSQKAIVLKFKISKACQLEFVSSWSTMSSPKRAFDGEIDIPDLSGKVILVTGGESVGLSSMKMNS
jgi:hypothetical protein